MRERGLIGDHRPAPPPFLEQEAGEGEVGILGHRRFELADALAGLGGFVVEQVDRGRRQELGWGRVGVLGSCHAVPATLGWPLHRWIV